MGRYYICFHLSCSLLYVSVVRLDKYSHVYNLISLSWLVRTNQPKITVIIDL